MIRVGTAMRPSGGIADPTSNRARTGNAFVCAAAPTEEASRVVAAGRLLSEATASAIATLADELKRLSHGRLLVLAFYGYTYTTADARLASFGHLSADTLIDHPSLDGFVSPYPYFRSARQQISNRLATYHTPADGIGNSSLRRMLVQCRDDLGSGLGFKLSYPDDALSLARDSEKEGKTTAHGNVAALAQLAEDARVDFRVLVLTRDLASAARSRMQPNATAAAIFSAAADHASRHAHRDAELALSRA